MAPRETSYVRDQNARVDPMLTIGTITVAELREALDDLPDEAVVIVAASETDNDCSPLADVEECWYFPASGDYAPIGRDGDGNVHEPGPRDLYAVLLQPAH